MNELLADVEGTLMLGVKHQALTSFEPEERRAILHEVERTWWCQREAARLPVLRERLVTWPASAWGTIFAERPDLENELTPEQRAEWEAICQQKT